MRKFTFLLLGIALAACGGNSSGHPAASSAEPKTIQPSSPPIPPPRPQNDPLAPIGTINLQTKILVTNSVPIFPVARVDIIDQKENRLMVSGAKLIYVQWKTEKFGSLPAYPASGIITVMLSENQRDALSRCESMAIIPTQ